MAAQVYVDFDNGLTTNNGLTVDTPWLLAPGQTGASTQTDYATTVSGMTHCNIRNGTSNALQLVPLANVTYRGYGLAANVLYLTLPMRDVRFTKQVRVVREVGVHEGMWILDAAGASTNGWLDLPNARSGIVVEDCQIVAPLSNTPVQIGGSASAGTSGTIRRSHVSGGAKYGISAYHNGLTIEDVLVTDTEEDGITIGSTAANSNRAGGVDVLRRISMRNVGYDEVAALGDGIQFTSAAGVFDSRVLIEDVYINKPSPVKQGIKVIVGAGGLTLQRFHLTSVAAGQNQILLTDVNGVAVISDGYMHEGQAGNSAIRISNGDSGVASSAASVVRIRNVSVDAEQHNGLFYWGGSLTAASIDGDVEISHCSINGINADNLSFSGTISAHPGATGTIGATASLSAKNCIFDVGGTLPIFRLPTGQVNNSRWVFTNNSTLTGTMIGAEGDNGFEDSTYATVALFQASHTYASGNIAKTAAELLLSATGDVLSSSPLILAGTRINDGLDQRGAQRWNPPAIGPLEYVRPRGAATARTAASARTAATPRGAV